MKRGGNGFGFFKWKFVLLLFSALGAPESENVVVKWTIQTMCE